MSAPIQLIRLRTSRTRHQGMRIAARIGMGAVCAAVFLMVFGTTYLNLPR